MENKRRKFIKNIMGLSLASTAMSFMPFKEDVYKIFEQLNKFEGTTDLEKNEEYWSLIQSLYAQSKEFINLENGYYSAQPTSGIDFFTEKSRSINKMNSRYMRTDMQNEYEEIVEKLAQFSGVSAEELIITRNTTESLNIVVNGLPMKKGDEAIVSTRDYPSMLAAFDLKRKRDGIVVNKVKLPMFPKNEMEVVRAFEKAITNKTKVIHATHLIHLTGQVLPIKEISEMAHQNGIEVISDSAHAFAHLDFKIPDLKCDYMGASLHKWLSASLGLGVLYVKRDKIEKLMPLYGDMDYADNDIRKLSHFGTRPPATHLSIGEAIDFHNKIGSELKEKRLRYLQNYWVNKVKELSKVTMNTPGGKQSCALANISIKGYTPNDLSKTLLDKYNIFTVAINGEEINGTRITVGLYNTIQELDALIKAIREIAE